MINVYLHFLHRNTAKLMRYYYSNLRNVGHITSCNMRNDLLSKLDITCDLLSVLMARRNTIT